MGKIVNIRLSDFDTIRKYASKVISFESDVDVIKGSVRYDGKSIMAMFALGTLDDIQLEIHSDNEDEIRRFNEEMKEFA